MESILIIESHAPARNALAKLLRYEGFVVVDAEAARVDAILVEVPFGIEAASAETTAEALVRKHPRAKVLFMACETWAPARVRGDVLMKPLDIDVLLAKLRAGARRDSRDSTP